MSEAARLSVAVEVTGEEQFTGAMSKLESAGKKAKASVDASMGGVSKDLAALQAMFDKSTGAIVGSVDRLIAGVSKGFAGVDAGMKKIQAGSRTASSAMSSDMKAAGASVSELDAIVERTTASVVAALREVVPATAAMSSGLGQSVQSMASFETATASMSAAAASLEGAIREVSAAQAAFASEIRKPANSNPFEKPAQGAEELRARLNPLYAIGLQYRKSVEEIQGAHSRGVISAAEMSDAIERAGHVATASQAAYVRLSDQIGSIGGKARLTGGQLQGLSFQANDIITMAAMGAAPMQIFASQIGQVVQVLQEGGGVKSSLAAIGSSIAGVARAIPTAGYAVAGVTAAVGALWYATSGPDARAAEETLKDFESAIKRLETGWKAAGDAAREYANAPTRQALDPNATFLDVRGNLKRLQSDLKTAIGDLNTSDLLSGRILRPFAGHVSDARREISTLYADLRTGEISAQQFADEMLRIRLDPNAEVHARNFAEQIRLALPDVIALERQVQALNQATARMAAPKGTMGRYGLPNEVFTDRFGPTVGGDNRFGSTEAMDRIREGLKGQREELEKTEKAVRTYSDAVAEQKAGLAASVAQLQLQVDTFGQSEGAIAAARFEMDALTEARRQAADANGGVLDPALVEVISKQAAEYGRLTDQLNAATKAQQDRLRVEREAEAQAKRVADFSADLDFQRSILTLPDSEQEIRTTLRGLGVDFSSFEGQRLAESMRYIDSVRKQQDALRETGSVTESLGDIFSDIFGQATRDGETFFDSVIRGLAGLGSQLAVAGAKNLWGSIFGTPKAANDNGGGGFINLFGGAPRAAANAPSMSYVPTPTARPEDFGKAAAAVSGQVLSYAGRFNKAVDGRLMSILETAASRFPYRVEAISGLRPGDSRFHGKGMAADVQIYDQSGRAFNNYQNAADFRVYEQFAQEAKRAQDQLFPELGKLFRWGGYFSGGKGKYGALDSMHFDVGGAGMGGGSWENGLTAAQRSLWKGVQSIGMGSASGDTRVVARGVSQGMQEFSRSGAMEGYDRGSFDAGTPSNPSGGMTRGQAVMGGLFGLAGIAAQGYQSGNPLMGGLSGAMGGFELGGSIATAFPSMAGIAGPAGMAIGAAVGLVSSPVGKRKAATQAEMQRRFNEHQAQKGNGRDSDQCVLAA